MFPKLPLVLLAMSCSFVAFAAIQNGGKNGAAPKTVAAPAEQKSSTFVPSQRIGVINVDQVMKDCEQTRDINLSMQEEFAKRQEELGKRVEEFQKLRKEGKITPAEAAKKESEFNIDAREMQVEFEGRSAEAQQMLVVALEKAAEVVAQKNAIDSYQPRFLYARKEVDVTGEIVAEMNRAYRAEKNASKFKAAVPAKASPAPAPKAPTKTAPAPASAAPSKAKAA